MLKIIENWYIIGFWGCGNLKMKGIISRQIPDSPSDSELISELTG